MAKPAASMCAVSMLCCMRTTIDVDDDLLRAARVAASSEDRTLTSVIEDALRCFLSASDQPAPPPVRLTTVKGRGLRPGVDLDDSAALLDLMEADDAAP